MKTTSLKLAPKDKATRETGTFISKQLLKWPTFLGVGLVVALFTVFALDRISDAEQDTAFQVFSPAMLSSNSVQEANFREGALEAYLSTMDHCEVGGLQLSFKEIDGKLVGSITQLPVANSQKTAVRPYARFPMPFFSWAGLKTGHRAVNIGDLTTRRFGAEVGSDGGALAARNLGKLMALEIIVRAARKEHKFPMLIAMIGVGFALFAFLAFVPLRNQLRKFMNGSHQEELPVTQCTNCDSYHDSRGDKKCPYCVLEAEDLEQPA